MPGTSRPSWLDPAAHQHRDQTHHRSSQRSPTPCRCRGILLFCQRDPSLGGARCPAPHQPCLAWRQAAPSQLSAPETSGISLGVSQNSPKAPLIPCSWCYTSTAASEHPRPGAVEGRLVAQPQAPGIPPPRGSPYIRREQGSSCNAERKQRQPKGDGERQAAKPISQDAGGELAGSNTSPPAPPRDREDAQHHPSPFARIPVAPGLPRIKQSSFPSG